MSETNRYSHHDNYLVQSKGQFIRNQQKVVRDKIQPDFIVVNRAVGRIDVYDEQDVLQKTIRFFKRSQRQERMQDILNQLNNLRKWGWYIQIAYHKKEQ